MLFGVVVETLTSVVGCAAMQLLYKYFYSNANWENVTCTNSPAADVIVVSIAPIVIPSICGSISIIYLKAVMVENPMVVTSIWLLVWLTRPIGEVPHASIFPLPGALLLPVSTSDPIPSAPVVLVDLCHQELVDLHACDGCKSAIHALTVRLRTVPGSNPSC